MTVLTIGSTGPEVRAWKEYLNSQGFQIDTSSDRFDPATLAATRQMQRRMGVKPDGMVGHRTLDRQHQLAATPLPQARPDMTPAPHPPTQPNPDGTPFVSSGPEADLNAMHSAASNRAWDQQVSADSVGHDTDMRAEQAAMLMNPVSPVTPNFTDQPASGAPAMPGVMGAGLRAAGMYPNFSNAGTPAEAAMDPRTRDQMIRMLLQSAGG